MAGHVSSVMNAAGKTASFEYDIAGRLVTETDLSGQKTQYSYDTSDRVISKKTADNEITYTYNEAGLPDSKTMSQL